MTKRPVKLLGNKKLQYILWIKKLRTIPRYREKNKHPWQILKLIKIMI
jgi:hypothetical protein